MKFEISDATSFDCRYATVFNISFCASKIFVRCYHYPASSLRIYHLHACTLSPKVANFPHGSIVSFSSETRQACYLTNVLSGFRNVLKASRGARMSRDPLLRLCMEREATPQCLTKSDS